MPVGTKPTEEEPIYEDSAGSWEWYYEEYYYADTGSDEEIDEEAKDELSLTFIDLFLITLSDETASLILEEISIQRWVHNMRDSITKGTTAEYLLGVGGKNVLDDLDLEKLSDMIKTQFGYFQKFAEEIRGGKLSGAQILQRIGMYGEAITNGYEQAKAKSHGITLPEYPADGNQQCVSNCRCHWDLRDDPKDSDYVLATWTLNPTAEHCVSCVDNSRKWNPLRVKKGG